MRYTPSVNMRTPDGSQEGQGKNKEARRSKIVLWAVAISAVIAMTAIQVKKMLNSTEKSQKPAAMAPEKTDEEENQPKKPVQRDSVISKDASLELLIEDEEFIGDCKPASLQDVCAILREADVNSVQCDIYTAVSQAFAFFNEGETLEDAPYSGIKSVFEKCDLDEKEQKQILGAGIQQGDTNTNEFAWNEIRIKCESLYQESPDYTTSSIKYDMKRKTCEEIPPEVTVEDVEKVDDTACKVAQEDAKKRCEDTEYPSICKDKADDNYNECFNSLLPGLSYDVAKKTPGTRLHCSTEAKREYKDSEKQWREQCHRDVSEEFGIEWEDVESLYKASQAEDFIRTASERVDCDGIGSYIDMLYELDVQHPDVLEILGVTNPDEIAGKYINDEVEKCILNQYEPALYFCSGQPRYLSCSWRGKEFQEYYSMYWKMEDIKKGKYMTSYDF